MSHNLSLLSKFPPASVQTSGVLPAIGIALLLALIIIYAFKTPYLEMFFEN
jgi:hypothetical protein